jgi:hypothetical protein
MKSLAPHRDECFHQSSDHHGAMNNAASAAAFVHWMALLTNDYLSENGWIFIENQGK